MTLWKSSALAALAAVVLTAGWLSFSRQRRTDEIARLRDANRSLRLATVPSAPRAATTSAGAPAARAPVANPVPRQTADTDYRNLGNATPQAALQTFAWACDKMDTELLAKLVYFDPAARAKAATFLAALPEKMRAEWRSPEDLAAIGLADAMQFSRFPPAVVLEKAEAEQLDENRVVLHLHGAAKERTEYQRTETGWKYVITEKAVDAFLASHAAKPGK